MKKPIFAVLDTKANAFGSLWVVNHTGEAVRAFTDQVNRADDQNMLYKHSEDFVLYHLGSYDDADGIIEPLDRPQLVVQGGAVKNPIH